MFDSIGFMELLLIGIVGLVVLGPERLPVAVRSITSWIRTMKRMANSVKEELEQELKIDQLHADLKKAEGLGLKNLSPELQESIEQLREAAQSVNRPYKIEDTPESTSVNRPYKIEDTPESTSVNRPYKIEDTSAPSSTKPMATSPVETKPVATDSKTDKSNG